jgi:hypothetical protein
MMMRTVFFSRAQGDFVVDELCTCGHLKRDHGSKLKPVCRGSKLKFRLPHDGNCCAGTCPCPHFTFARHIGVEEFLKRFPIKQSKRLARVASG